MVLPVYTQVLRQLGPEQLERLLGVLLSLQEQLQEYHLLFVEIGQADAWAFENDTLREQIDACRRRLNSLVSL